MGGGKRLSHEEEVMLGIASSKIYINPFTQVIAVLPVKKELKPKKVIKKVIKRRK